jgi:GDP-mannose 6-dehydrogenase
VLGLDLSSRPEDLRDNPLVNVVEALIGKGRDVRILDRGFPLAQHVEPERYRPAGEFAHLESLVCRRPEGLVEHADVLVIGCVGEDAAGVLALSRPDQIVVDLTRNARSKAFAAQEAA